MNRVLKRPMFRRGGSAGGITSGLRQGYKNAKRVLPDDLRSKQIKDIVSGETTIGEAQDLSRALSYKPRGTNVYDFMSGMGINLLSQPAHGNIWQQGARASKEPYEKYLTGKGRAGLEEYASESDMFKTLIKAGATGIGEGKTYAHRDKAAMVRENMDQQYKIYDQLETLDPDDLEYEDNRKGLLEELRTLKELVSGDEFAKAQLQYWNKDENSRKLDRLIKQEIGKKLGVDPETSFVENREFAEAFIKRRSEIMDDIRLGLSPTFDFAKGGRVGYQMGNMVQAAPTAMPTAAPAETMPAELGGITYEELRARLPQEIGDEIVRLLANSAEALEDFATIQTEQDIANFNKKYGVNLVLPSEG